MKFTGDEVQVSVQLKPQVCSGEASICYGTAFDRFNFESAVFGVLAGDTANTPTNVLLTFGLQEADTETGSYTTVVLTDYTVTITGERAVIPGADLEIAMNLRGLKRWLKPNVKTNFTGGSSPTVIAGIVAVLGEAKVGPG